MQALSGKCSHCTDANFITTKIKSHAELIAHTIVSKYADAIPLYRQSKIWGRVDIDLPRSTLCCWLINVAKLCEPLVNITHQEMLLDNYIQADESTIQVLKVPGRKDTSKSYLWVYRGDNNVIFDYQQTRGGYHAQQFLKNFKGYLQTDAYSGYHFTEKINDIIHIGCMAHARRPFAQLAKLAKKEGLATKALLYFKKLYAIESYARDNNLTNNDRYKLRNEDAPPILDELHVPQMALIHTNIFAPCYIKFVCAKQKMITVNCCRSLSIFS